MKKRIEWIIEMLSKEGINSKALIKEELENMTIDDWYTLRDECNEEIISMRNKGFKPEANPNILMLKSYQADVYQCMILQREIEVLSNFVRGPNYSGMPLPPMDSNPVEQQHIRLIEAKRRLEYLLASRGFKIEKCMKVLEKVKDARGKYILTGIFLEGKTLYQIQVEAPFSLSYKQIYRLKKEALDDIRQVKQGGSQ